MKSLVENLLKFRTPILIFLIFTLVVLSSTSFIDDVDDDNFLLTARSLGTFLIMLFSLILLDKLNYYQFLSNKLNFIQDLSPSQYMYYDFNTKELSIPNVTRAALYLDKKQKYSLSDISKFFSLTEWDEISKYIENPMSYLNIEKIGMVGINITPTDKIYFKYSMQSIRDREYGIYGVILWFVDFTQTRIAEMELISLLQKYRNMSFDLDLLFDKIPFPIWKKNSKGELIQYNKSFEKILKNSDINLMETIKRNTSESFTKKLLVKNNSHTYKFNETYIEITHEKIGYAIDISDSDVIKKNIKSLQNTIDTTLELSSNAILVIDSKKRIIQFNSALVNLFGLERTWLSQNPNYLAYLDKLKELGKLQEVADYKDYKTKHFAFLNTLKEPYHTLLNQPNGDTLRVSIVPTDIGNTVFIYDNISDILGIERSYNELMETLTTIISELNEAVCITDHAGNIKLYNSVFKDVIISNISAIEMNSTFHETISKSNNNTIKNNIKTIIEELNIASEHRKNRSSSISFRDQSLNFTVSPLPDNSTLIVFHL